MTWASVASIQVQMAAIHYLPVRYDQTTTNYFQNKGEPGGILIAAALTNKNICMGLS